MRRLGGARARSFIDLHCHTSWSPDSLSPPKRVAEVAAERGLTHLAITDHGRIDGALEARANAPTGLTVIVGEEICTQEGDLIGLFLSRPVPAGLSAEEAAAAIHEQGGLAGLPHPFDRSRVSVLAADRGAGRPGDRFAGRLEALAPLLDYVETFNARVPFGATNERAAAWAKAHDLPGVAVSDAHTLLEVGVAYSIVESSNGAGDWGVPSSFDPPTLRDSLRRATLVTSRASLAMRAVTPVARLIQRLRYPERFAGRT